MATFTTVHSVHFLTSVSCLVVRCFWTVTWTLPLTLLLSAHANCEEPQATQRYAIVRVPQVRELKTGHQGVPPFQGTKRFVVPSMTALKMPAGGFGGSRLKSC